MEKTGQSGLEFMILVGAVFFSFVIFIGSLQEQRADQISSQRNYLIKEIAFTVQDEIALASNSISGYSRNFTLPNDVLGAEYNASIYAGSINVATKNGKHALSLPVLNVTGDIRIGQNNIMKVNERVYLNS